jgi:PAS domain-containing protein
MDGKLTHHRFASPRGAQTSTPCLSSTAWQAREIEMTENVADVAPLPTVRTTAFDPPAELRKRQPISPLRFMDGHIGWLVTNHAMARELLADRRFSSRNELRHRTVGRSILSAEVNHSLTRGAFVDMDPPGHTRFRRLLTGQFTVRRMKQLEPWIEAIVEERLEAMLRAGPPADLVRSFALPIPSLVICELLGIPYAERSRFQHDTATLLRTNVTVEESEAARKSMQHGRCWRAERDLEVFFNLSPDLLCISGFDGYFRRVNPAAERTLGYTAEELLSIPWWDLIHPDDRARTREGCRRPGTRPGGLPTRNAGHLPRRLPNVVRIRIRDDGVEGPIRRGVPGWLVCKIESRHWVAP